MNENLKKIHQYLLNTGVDPKDIESHHVSSVGLAMEITEHTHRGQKRGERGGLRISSDLGLRLSQGSGRYHP